jgi:hypothetical protein
MLQAAGKPYVIENVEGSGAELRPNLVLTGRDVGLCQMHRKRYFHVSGLPGTHMSIDGRTKVSGLEAAYLHIHGGQYVRRETLIEVFGLDCIPEKRRARLSRVGIEQGVPPVMTKWIAERMFANKFMIG